MLAHPETDVVFAPKEKITQGNQLVNGIEITLNGYSKYKSAIETMLIGNFESGTR